MQTKTLKLPLSPAQVKVLTLMREGYSLHKSYRFDLLIWLRRTTNEPTHSVTKQCFTALINRELIIFHNKIGGISRYVLTEKGKTYQDKPKRKYIRHA